MAKKKSDKETEPKKVSTKRFSAFFKNETTHFVIGLISVIFAVYLLLAFTSFFFTGAADQSILDNQQPVACSGGRIEIAELPVAAELERVVLHGQVQ